MASFCGECGSPITTAVKFCPECGKPVAATAPVIPTPTSSTPISVPPSVVPVVVHEEHHALACPSCQKVDAVQKVSTVVGQGASSIGLSGGFVATATSYHATTINPLDHVRTTTIGGIQLAGGSRTLQSSMLAPPTPPEYVNPWKGIVGSLIFGILAIFLGIGLIAALLQSVFRGSPISVLIHLGWLLLLVGWPIHKIWSTNQQAIAARDAYEQKLPRWREAMRRWEHLYYCFRCDGVFIPGKSALIPTSDTASFIFNSATPLSS